MSPRTSVQLILFAKHLKEMDVPALVREARAANVAGYDFPIRDGFAVTPANVRTALPELVRALKSEGLALSMCTGEGGMTDPAHPIVEPVLAAMAQSGVRLFKMGYFLFDPAKQDYWQEVDRIRRALEGWAALAEKHGVTVCYHTHSGRYMGSTAAGLHHLIHEFNPRHIGGYLDAGHLSAAGEDFGMACSVLGDQLKVVGIKEVTKGWRFRGGQWQIVLEEAPLGKGWLEPQAVFAHLLRIGFAGPVSIHVEYEGTQEQLIQWARRDAGTIRQALDDARNCTFQSQ